MEIKCLFGFHEWEEKIYHLHFSGEYNKDQIVTMKCCTRKKCNKVKEIKYESVEPQE